MTKKALSLVLIAVLLLSAMCWMTPNIKAVDYPPNGQYIIVSSLGSGKTEVTIYRIWSNPSIPSDYLVAHSNNVYGSYGSFDTASIPANWLYTQLLNDAPVTYIGTLPSSISNRITNGGFEDPLATQQDAGNWEGGTRVNSDSYTGSYSLYTVYNQLVRERIVGLLDGAYYFSMMYKPIVTADMSIQIGFKGNTLFSSLYVALITVIDDSITQEAGSVTNVSVSIASDGWRTIAFEITLDRTGYPDFTDWHIKFPYTADGFIDDVWLSTTGAISYYSGVSLSSPTDDSTTSSLDVNFTYTPSMNNTIMNASLWLNSYNVWQRVTNTTTVTNGTLNNFTYALPYQGVYLWNIEVWDSENYFFAPANYTLTVQQGTINYGSWYDSCENLGNWSGSTASIDTSDYAEGLGSINITYATSYSPSLPSYDGSVLGFFMKYYQYPNCSSQRIYIVEDMTNYRGFTLIARNTTHFYFAVKDYTTVYYTSDIAYSGNWTWIEVRWNVSTGINPYELNIWVDGANVYSQPALNFYPLTIFYPQTMNNYSGSWKIDFLRYADVEEYPVFLTPTVDVTSNPELNAFFSMATNVSSLMSETLCVDGLVNETFSDLGHVGASPYLDSQDDNTSYVQTNLATATYDQYYTFNDTTLLTISSSTIHYRVASFPINTSVWLVVDTYFWNGGDYTPVNSFIHSGDWATLNSSALDWQLPKTPDILNQLRLKVSMHLNQQVPGITYMGRLSAVWIDVSGYGNPEGAAVHQTPYSFNPVSATYVFIALNTTLYSLGTEYRFSGFTYDGSSYNGSTLILTSLSGVTSIVLEYSIVVPSGGVFLVPFMFLFWVIGLFCLFLGPVYAIDKVKKHEYLTGMVGGVILCTIGFGLFIGGLWGITL